MGGKSSCGNLVSDITPKSITPANIITVVTGFLVEKSGNPIFSFQPSAVCCQLSFGPFRDALEYRSAVLTETKNLEHSYSSKQRFLDHLKNSFLDFGYLDLVVILVFLMNLPNNKLPFFDTRPHLRNIMGQILYGYLPDLYLAHFALS